MTERDTEWWERLLHVTVWFGKWFFYLSCVFSVAFLVMVIIEGKSLGFAIMPVWTGGIVYFLTLLLQRIVGYVVKGS